MTTKSGMATMEHQISFSHEHSAEAQHRSHSPVSSVSYLAREEPTKLSWSKLHSPSSVLYSSKDDKKLEFYRKQRLCEIGGYMYREGETVRTFELKCGSVRDFPCVCAPDLDPPLWCPYCGIYLSPKWASSAASSDSNIERLRISNAPGFFCLKDGETSDPFVGIESGIRQVCSCALTDEGKPVSKCDVASPEFGHNSEKKEGGYDTHTKGNESGTGDSGNDTVSSAIAEGNTSAHSNMSSNASASANAYGNGNGNGYGTGVNTAGETDLNTDPGGTQRLANPNNKDNNNGKKSTPGFNDNDSFPKMKTTSSSAFNDKTSKDDTSKESNGNTEEKTTYKNGSGVNDGDDDVCTLELPGESGETMTFRRGESYGPFLRNRCQAPSKHPCYCDPDAYRQMDCPYCGFDLGENSLLCARHNETVSFFAPDGPHGEVRTCSCSIQGTPITNCETSNHPYVVRSDDGNASPGASSHQETITTGGQKGCPIKDPSSGRVVAVVPDGASFGEYASTVMGTCGDGKQWPAFCDASSDAEPTSAQVKSSVTTSQQGLHNTLSVDIRDRADVLYPYCVYLDVESGSPVCARDKEEVVYTNDEGIQVKCSCVIDEKDSRVDGSFTCGPYTGNNETKTEVGLSKEQGGGNNTGTPNTAFANENNTKTEEFPNEVEEAKEKKEEEEEDYDDDDDVGTAYNVGDEKDVKLVDENKNNHVPSTTGIGSSLDDNNVNKNIDKDGNALSSGNNLGSENNNNDIPSMPGNGSNLGDNIMNKNMNDKNSDILISDLQGENYNKNLPSMTAIGSNLGGNGINKNIINNNGGGVIEDSNLPGIGSNFEGGALANNRPTLRPTMSPIYVPQSGTIATYGGTSGNSIIVQILLTTIGWAMGTMLILKTI
ncbi:unnamed protein product [Pseudo-nitzschia multistriata]|uniref:Uncharacterized protein n=1 Tax=Pseudo-nitzschia multistriata TaxID=183589 RepID=A0A448Z2M7_9STRA|nr:unnamed protein product [Pseudo-nitzschia multistriata]